MDKRIEDLETIKSVFDKFGVKFFLVYGALLGFYRDGDFLPGDDDIDLAVTANLSLQERKQIGWMLYDLGFAPQPISFNVYGRMEPSEPGYNGDDETGIIVCERNFKFTIFFFTETDCPTHGKEYLCVPKLGALKLISTPSKFFDSEKYIKIHKKKYFIPDPIEEYLAFTYFDNWKDKTDRRHGELYNVMHGEDPS